VRFLCDLPPPRAPTHPARDRSDHDGKWTQPPVTTPEVQAPQAAVPVFCGCFSAGCRSANRGVKMVPQFMEQHPRQHHVAKEVQRKDKRRPTSDSIVNHDFNERRRSAVFPMIKTQTGAAIVLPACHTPGLPDAYRGGISENNRPETGEVRSGNRRQQPFDRRTNPSRSLVLPVRLMNRRHYSDCAPDGRSTGLQDAIAAAMVQQIARISKEGGRRQTQSGGRPGELQIQRVACPRNQLSTLTNVPCDKYGTNTRADRASSLRLSITLPRRGEAVGLCFSSSPPALF
jgi:hypothetical protein